MASDDVIALLTQQVKRLVDEVARLNDHADTLGYPSRAAVAGSTVAGASKCVDTVHIFAWGSHPGEPCDCGLKTWAA